MGTFDVILTDNGSNAPPNENTSPPEQITIRIDRPPNFTTAFSPISANLGDFIPAFFVGVADVDSSVGILVLSGSSDNQSVLPDGNIQVLGSGANRFLLLTPTGEGSATVTVSLTDGANTVTEQFTLTVSPMPDLVLTRDLPAFYRFLDVFSGTGTISFTEKTQPEYLFRTLLPQCVSIMARLP